MRRLKIHMDHFKGMWHKKSLCCVGLIVRQLWSLPEAQFELHLLFVCGLDCLCLQPYLSRPLFQHVRGEHLPLGSSHKNIAELASVCVPVLAAHSAVTHHLVCAVKTCTCSLPEMLLLRRSRRTRGQGGKPELSLSFIMCPLPFARTQTHRDTTHTKPVVRSVWLPPRIPEEPRSWQEHTAGARWAAPRALLNSCANKLEGSSKEI